MTELKTVDQVLKEYSHETVEFSPEMLAWYLNKYPVFKQELLNYASLWVSTIFATEEEIAKTTVPESEILTITERALKTMNQCGVEDKEV